MVLLVVFVIVVVLVINVIVIVNMCGSYDIVAGGCDNDSCSVSDICDS